jgi:hypothetical protein
MYRAMHFYKLLIGIAVLFCVFPAWASGQKSLKELYALKESKLEVGLTLYETSYLLREPIWMKIKVTNVGLDTGRFYFRNFDALQITDSKGKIYPCRISVERHPRTINPGETLAKESNLLTWYGSPEDSFHVRHYLPPEKYSIYYALNKNVKSQTYHFEIHEPKNDELKAMNLLKEAYDLQVLKKDESYKDKLKELLKKYPESRYYVYALLMNADSLDDWYDLIQRFPESREAVRAVRSIALTFEKEKDKKGYTQAMNGLIEKYPNTDIAKEAQKQLEKVDYLKFE